MSCSAAVQDFCILHNDMEGWGVVPRDVVNALTPEKAVKHAKKMLMRDCRMRVYMPQDNQHGAMYLCNQAQVNLADGNSSGASLFLLLPLQTTVMSSYCSPFHHVSCNYDSGLCIIQPGIMYVELLSVLQNGHQRTTNH